MTLPIDIEIWQGEIAELEVVVELTKLERVVMPTRACS